ncbi:riboflavin synthase [Proteinivorax hydrogeniformans]|uniref:Riboflavin synthase n=1 Tax=Proteinivorax hydrogeniformans TaxID=1826727 RepID=A0AAU8HVA3_9FIRM
MFTGLVEEVGKVQKVKKSIKSCSLTISAKKVLDGVKLGDSISTNGVCLTVVSFTSNSFDADVMPETMDNSNLGKLNIGSEVNLERALQLGNRLGGHMVSGHIDDIGTILNFRKDENATWVTIKPVNTSLKYVIEKGSIAIDGTSLTVADVNDDSFKVSIIPLTGEDTTLLKNKIGDEVNLEYDLVGKYVEKLVNANKTENDSKNSIDISFLQKNGFA